MGKWADRRKEKREDRWNYKLQKQNNRLDTKEAAYAAGIDPNAWIGSTIGAAGNAVSNVLGTVGGNAANKLIAGQGFAPEGGYLTMPGQAESNAKSTNMMMWVIGAVALVMLFMFRKK